MESSNLYPYFEYESQTFIFSFVSLTSFVNTYINENLQAHGRFIDVIELVHNDLTDYFINYDIPYNLLDVLKPFLCTVYFKNFKHSYLLFFKDIEEQINYGISGFLITDLLIADYKIIINGSKPIKVGEFLMDISTIKVNDRISFTTVGQISNGYTFVSSALVLGVMHGLGLQDPSSAATTHARLYSSFQTSVVDNYTAYPYLLLQLANNIRIEVGFPWIEASSIERVQDSTLQLLIPNFDPTDVNEVIQLLADAGYTNVTTKLM